MIYNQKPSNQLPGALLGAFRTNSASRFFLAGSRGSISPKNQKQQNLTKFGLAKIKLPANNEPETQGQTSRPAGRQNKNNHYN